MSSNQEMKEVENASPYCEDEKVQETEDTDNHDDEDDLYEAEGEEDYGEEEEVEEEKKEGETTKNFTLYPVNLDAIGPSKKFPRNWLKTLLHKNNQLETNIYMKYNQNDPIMRDKALVVAPMVDQSDLPFRLLCRKYGSNLCFTPMIHARLFIEKKIYRDKFWDYENKVGELDRPLVAQFCSSDIPSLVQAAYSIQHQVDAIDLNCGCPQNIAKRGNYGAFLLEEPHKLIPIVRALSGILDIPITVKVRILPSGLKDSLNLYQQIIDAGASMLTIHGRNRFQKGQETGKADWNAIRTVVDKYSEQIPILANGSIQDITCVRKCLVETQADGVMTSEAILEYPALFTGFYYNQDIVPESDTPTTSTSPPAEEEKRKSFYEEDDDEIHKSPDRAIGRLQLAQEFLDMCRMYPPHHGGQGTGFKCMRVHLHRFLHCDLQDSQEIRTKLTRSDTFEELQHIIDCVRSTHEQKEHIVKEEQPSWYVRHRVKSTNDPNKTNSRVAWEKTKIVKCVELDEETGQCIAGMFGDDW